ncbi:MAG: hypothetical protein QN175_10750 [Armatimonadota bacterium]|nr:hypothetical protein [Armatimonadota bacterium]
MLVDCRSRDEAHYVCALLNSSLTVAAVLGYAVEIQMDPHILEHVCIRHFDPKARIHQRLAELSAQAHEAAGREDAAALRRVEAEIDRQAARLWGLTDQELAEIQRSLKELSAAEPSAEEEVADAVERP